MSNNPFEAPKAFGSTAGNLFDNSSSVAPTNVFGGAAQTSAFGSGQSSVFGQTGPASINPVFGQNSAAAGTFGSTSAPLSFGAARDTPTVFGSSAPQTTSFNSLQTNFSSSTTKLSGVTAASSTTTSSSIFGNTTGSAFGKNQSQAPSSSGNVFGGQTGANPFGNSSISSTGNNGSSQGTVGVFGAVPHSGKQVEGQVPASDAFGSRSVGVFGASTGTKGAFGGATTSSTTVASVFGGKHATFGTNVKSVFGNVTQSTNNSKHDPVSTVAPAVTFNFTASKPPASVSSVFGGSSHSSTVVASNVFGGGGGSDRTSSGGSYKVSDNSSAESKRRLNVSTGTGKHGDTHVELASDEEEGRPPNRNDASRKQLFKQEDLPQEGSSEGVQKRPVIKRTVKAPAPGGGLFGKALAGVAGGNTTGFKVIKSVDSSKPEETGSTGDDDQSSARQSTASVQRRVSSSALPTSRRTSLSSEEISTKTAIVCKNVDASINKISILRSHFSRFGKVKKVIPQLRSQSAIIHFDDHESAANAKKRGRFVDRDVEPVNLYWSTYSPASKAMAGTSGALMSSTKTAASKRPEKSVNKDVDDELQSMMGPSDVADDLIDMDRPSLQKKKVTGIKKLSSTAGVQEKRKRRESTKSSSKTKEPAKRAATPAETENVPGVSFVSLKSLTNVLAKSTSERYEILDNRDKIMKMGRTKQADLATAKVFVGTCRDMCPEKERYVREDRRRLSKYEIIPGTDGPGVNPSVDHARAVKEYSRSSADQEEPLLHELRPSDVLDMTMDYLMNNIMDLGGEGLWEDWFEFLWSRTRGIRKDITQQMLCDLTSTQLTEKCARFHIYCSERLCEERMQVFDSKINNENLTKCLQSLKEMYADLEKNQNVLAPNEAEFRAYMVLMNLNQGDTLREVQQLREELRSSPQINFVLSVYAALNFNNYVRFFKLVKKAPFLYACIMHRYFTQVRRKALLTIIKAFGIPNHRQYPVSELVKQLAFEDETEATEFCEHHGLTVQEDGIVLLDRTSFIEPEAAFPERRAVRLIESKQTVSVGEVVNGGPLAPFNLHIPASSFTDEGRFRVDDISIPRLESKPQEIQGTPEQDTEAPSTEKTQQQQPQAPLYSNEAIKDVAKELFLEIIHEMCVGIGTTLESAINTYLASANHILDDIIEQVTHQEIRKIHEDLVTTQVRQAAERKAAAEREAAAQEATRRQITAETQDALLQEVLLHEMQNTATAAVRDHRNAMKRDRVERCSFEVSTTLLENFVDEEISNIANEIHDDVEKRLCEMEENRKCVELLRTARFFKRWRDKYAKQLRLQRAMLNFPVAPSVLDSRHQLGYLVPDSEGRIGTSQHLGKKARLSLESPSQREASQKRLIENVTLQNYVRRLHRQKAWASYNLQKSVAQLLRRGQMQQNRRMKEVKEMKKLYWKLFLSVPDLEENNDIISDQSGVLVDWIQKKFKKGIVPCDEDLCDKVKLLSLYSTPVEGSSGSSESLSVCVRSCAGALTEEETQRAEKLFLGTNGLLFYLPPPIESSDDEQCYWLLSHLRLAAMVQLIPVFPPVPLIVVIATTASWQPSEEEVTENLNVDSFIEQGCLSTYSVVYLDPDVNSLKPSEQLLKGLKWLATNCPSQPRLAKQPIRELLEDTLNKEFYTPLYQNLSCRRKQGYLHQAPDVIIALYNNVIDHISQAISNEHLLQYSWPVPEFLSHDAGLPEVDWNSCEHLGLLSSLMESLCLPEFSYGDEHHDDWHSACQDVWNYVDLLTQDEHSKVPLYSRIRGLLRKSRADFEDRCYLELDEAECSPTYLNLPWTEIITACVAYQLCTLQPAANHKEDEACQEILVHYREEDLEKFHPPVIWTEALREENQHEETTLDASVLYSAKRKKEETLVCTSPKQPKLDQSKSFIDLEPESVQITTARATANELASFMGEEKRKSLQYEEFLQRSLNIAPSIGENVILTPDYATSSQNLFSMDSLPLLPRFSAPLFPRAYTSYHRISDSGCTAPPVGENTDISSDVEQHQKRRRHSLNEGVLSLQHEIEANKAANRLYEMRLRRMLGE